MTTTTTSTDDLANIPHPPGATCVHEWFNDDQPPGAVVNHVRSPRTWPAASSQRGPRRPTKSTRWLAIWSTSSAGWPAATSP